MNLLFSIVILLISPTANALKLVKSLPEARKIAGDFNVKKVFSDDRILSNLGNLLCARPFPRSNEIRFVTNFIYTKDYSGPNKDEVDAMPSELKRNYQIELVQLRKNFIIIITH